MPLHSVFQERLGGYTSDHSLQVIDVTFSKSNGPALNLKGATWNVLNRCHSKEDSKSQFKKYSNNPFDITESVEEYKARKFAQIERLKEIMQNGTDFIFLQEVDWCMLHRHDDECNAVKKEIQQKLSETLRELGWGQVISCKIDYQQTPLVILYKESKLQLVNNSPRGCFPFAYTTSGSDRRYYGYSAQFEVRDANLQKVSLLNLHLPYAHECTPDISRQIGKYAFSDNHLIMGGDTNTPSHSAFATNIDRVDDVKSHELTDTHTSDKKPKGYDAFYACGNGATTVTADISGSERFALTDDGMTASVQTLDNVPRITPPAGEPLYPSMVTLGQDSPAKETLPKPGRRRR